MYYEYSRPKAALLLFAAAVFFAGQSLLIKLTEDALTTWHHGAGRFIIGIAGCIWLAKPFGQSVLGDNKKLLVVRGCIGSVGFFCMAASIQMLPISQALVLFFLFPAFSALFSTWINREPTSWTGWLVIGFAFAGAYLVLSPDDGPFVPKAGHLVAITGALCAGMVIALIRKLGSSNGPHTLYFYLCLMGLPPSLIMLGVTDVPLIPDALNFYGLIAAAVLGLVAQIAMNLGIKNMPAAQSGVILMSQVVIAGFIGVVWMGDPWGFNLMAGSALILGAGVKLGSDKPAPVKVKTKRN